MISEKLETHQQQQQHTTSEKNILIYKCVKGHCTEARRRKNLINVTYTKMQYMYMRAIKASNWFLSKTVHSVKVGQEYVFAYYTTKF